MVVEDAAAASALGEDEVDSIPEAVVVEGSTREVEVDEEVAVDVGVEVGEGAEQEVIGECKMISFLSYLSTIKKKHKYSLLH